MKSPVHNDSINSTARRPKKVTLLTTHKLKSQSEYLFIDRESKESFNN